MKKIIALTIIVSLISAFAQAEFGMKMRLRSEMQNLNSSNADNQIYGRSADLRLRPDIGYKVNEYISVKAVLEIGDIQYGTNGGALGTDGINLQTKNLYMGLRTTPNHLFKLGLIPYKDAHSMIIDTDLAGVTWEGLFNNYSVNLGWFVSEDKGEKYISESSFSFGTSVLLADMDYKFNEMLTLGLNNIFVLDREEFGATASRQGVSIFFAPRIKASMGPFAVDAQFVANNNYAVYSPYEPYAGFQQPKDPDKTGLALSVKSKFKMDEKTTFRANLLFRGCYENWENYESYKSDYDTGLEIINEKPYGISRHNPMNEFTVQSLGKEEQLGIVVPAIFVDWKYLDNVTFTGGFGLIMNDAPYGKKINYGDLLEGKNKDMFIAWELDLKAKVTMYEDNITFLPYFALFVPTDNFAYNKVGGLENFDDNLDPASDPQIKVGMTVNYNF